MIVIQIHELIKDRDLSIRQVAEIVEDVRLNFVFSEEASALDDTVFAKHHALVALAKLEEAIQTFRLADAVAARERAGNL